MKTSVVKSLGHGVVVVGQNQVRNFVLGHQLERQFNPAADNVFIDMQTSGKALHFTLRAEDHAKKCNNEYLGLAMAAGYIYDIFFRWMQRDPQLQEQWEPYLEYVWRHGLRAATFAWFLATHERVLISHRKIIFVAGLLHDIGKLGLVVLNPEVYAICLQKMKELRAVNMSDDAYEAVVEAEQFDMTHPEVGSAIVFQTKFLRDLDMEVDFHHDITLLKTRNPDAFLGSAIINIADRMAWLYEQSPNFGVNELQEVLKPHAGHFPLKAHDVFDLYASIRSRGLLGTGA